MRHHSWLMSVVRGIPKWPEYVILLFVEYRGFKAKSYIISSVRYKSYVMYSCSYGEQRSGRNSTPKFADMLMLVLWASPLPKKELPMISVSVDLVFRRENAQPPPAVGRQSSPRPLSQLEFHSQYPPPVHQLVAHDDTMRNSGTRNSDRASLLRKREWSLPLVDPLLVLRYI